MMERRSGAWPLAAALLLITAAGGAAAQDNFCADAVEPGSGGPESWQWLGGQQEPSLQVLPPDVWNATLAAFQDRYLYNPAPGQEAWVPCIEDELLVSLDGCFQDGDGTLAYQLRVNLTCVHVEHTDAASFDALVLLEADGSTQVDFSSVVLQVDASHYSDQPCDDPLCAVCRAGPPAAAGQPPLPQVCDVCLLHFKVNSSTGRCEEPPAVPEAKGSAQIQESSSPAAAASSAQPAYSPQPYAVPSSTSPQLSPAMPASDTSIAVPGWFAKYCVPRSENCKQVDPRESPSKPCGQGWFIIAQESSSKFWCSRCSRPGCQDCARCYEEKGGCRGAQFCLAPCAAGSMWVQGSCLPCTELIAGCDLCERCTLGSSTALNKMCQVRGGGRSGVRCLRCKERQGWWWMGDGTARCRPLR
ncbi:transcription termination factor Rho isoform B [Chlorella sorokiniana]|uniref:Transcription termination factor Rho isoform B n=1 Tax=Chlorella sorokiniana TaxID=3076 RepID=A0A2P6U3R2_CHLSO|nr:transcription termination factor Rho isoform B [Chlorella sorokiniana]|eukprot:PRW60939.1 transcription termination factor Rho isoform B [Chlorella sorokiniana]